VSRLSSLRQSLTERDIGRFSKYVEREPLPYADFSKLHSNFVLKPQPIYDDYYAFGRLASMEVNNGWNLFSEPYGILAYKMDVSPSLGNNGLFLIITDYEWHRLIVAGATEEEDDVFFSLGQWGWADNQFNRPYGLVNVGSHSWYICDNGKSRIAKFWSQHQVEDPGDVQYGGDLGGNYRFPNDIDACVDGPQCEYLVVANQGNHNLVKMDFQGYGIQNYGYQGSGVGGFEWPVGVAVDRDHSTGLHTGSVFVADRDNNRIVKVHYNNDNHLFFDAGWQEVALQSSANPHSIDVDNRGNIYITSGGASGILKFTRWLEPVAYFGGWGEGRYDLYFPNCFAFAHGYGGDVSDPYALILGTSFVTESWGDSTGVRKYGIGTDVKDIHAEWSATVEDPSGVVDFDYVLAEYSKVVISLAWLGIITVAEDTIDVQFPGRKYGSIDLPGGLNGPYSLCFKATTLYDPPSTLHTCTGVNCYPQNQPPVITCGPMFLTFDSSAVRPCQWSGTFTKVWVEAEDFEGEDITYFWECQAGVFQATSGKDDMLPPLKDVPEDCRDTITTSVGRVWYQSWHGEYGCSCTGSPLRCSFKVTPISGDVEGETVETTVVVLNPMVDEWEDCTEYPPGDANGSLSIDIDDIVYLINYAFCGGPAPVTVRAGDANCSGGDPSADIDDIVYLINYVYGGGPMPCWCF
jgi:hypothetical protein